MQELLTHATIPKNMAFLLLKDGSYPLVLRATKLVQLQIKVINILTSSIIIIFIILIYPILISLRDFYKNKNYPKYIKTSVKLAFTISIIHIIVFIHLGNETIVSN
jgi:heme/copper-type cytochrome/quinol oxidase subunit 2